MARSSRPRPPLRGGGAGLSASIRPALRMGRDRADRRPAATAASRFAGTMNVARLSVCGAPDRQASGSRGLSLAIPAFMLSASCRGLRRGGPKGRPRPCQEPASGPTPASGRLRPGVFGCMPRMGAFGPGEGRDVNRLPCHPLQVGPLPGVCHEPSEQKRRQPRAGTLSA